MANRYAGTIQLMLVIAVLIGLVLWVIPPTLVSAAPNSPTTCATNPSLVSGEWQNLSAQPTFSWDAVAGAEGYFIYFGSSAGGTSTDLITGTSYQPAAPVTTGRYYLNINTKDPGEETPDVDWANCFVLRYDDSAPVIEINETGGASHGTWQNSVTSPVFTISLNDEQSGSPSGMYGWNAGECLAPSGPIASPFSPGVLADGEYCLNINAQDDLGNNGQSSFIFRLDTTPPGVVNSVTETNGSSSGVWASIASPTFTWADPGGAASYNIYWGPDNSSTTANFTGINPPFSQPATEGTENYLRIQAVDAAGNLGAWSDVLFTYWLDTSGPTPVTGIIELDNNIQSGVCTLLREFRFSWDESTTSGSPLKGYYYYWGSDPNPLVVTPHDRTDVPPVTIKIAKGDKIYLRIAAYDEAGNISPWSSDFIICNGDSISLVEADKTGNVNFGVPDPQVHASFSFPTNAYQIKIGDDWIGQPFWARMWYPAEDNHRSPDITKLAPFNHQSFNLDIDQTGNLATLEQLTNPYTLTITYTEGSVLAIDEDTLKVYRWDGEKWNDLNTQFLDTDTNTITASSTTPGEFIVMGTPIPVEQRLTLTAGAITFGNVSLTGSTRTIQGQTQPWIILDANDKDNGWYVTIRGSDFSDGAGHVIPIGNLTIQIPPDHIDLEAGTIPPVSQVTAPTQLLTTDLSTLFCDIGANTGRYAIRPLFELELPAETYGGSYHSQIIITLINNPPSP